MTDEERYYAGESIVLWASDLTHLFDGPVTGDAVVVFTVTNRAGVVVEGAGGTGVASNDDWYVVIALPEAPGVYYAKATATVDGKVWHGKIPLYVDAH